MSEQDFQRAVILRIDERGLGWYHRPDRPDPRREHRRGWPDLVIWGRGGLIFRELKSELGRASREQLRLGRELAAAGADWALWRPEQLLDGTISAELSRLSQQRRDSPKSE